MIKCDHCGEEIEQSFCPDCLRWTLKTPSEPLREDFDPSKYTYSPEVAKDQ